jgi:hypothetical protein
MGEYSDFLGGAFRIPFGHPPKWLLMLTAFVDETTQEQREGFMFVAGYVGDEPAWRRVEKCWLAAIAPRDHLHMNRLRFARESERQMLLRVAAISKECGLTPIFGGVRQADYLDLVEGSEEERRLAGYLICVFPLIIGTLRNIPKNERLEITFSRQDRYWPLAELAVATIAKARYYPPILMSDGRPKLAHWHAAPQQSEEALTEIADAFCYALLQAWRDKKSRRAQWCKPILDAHDGGYGQIFKGSEIRPLIQSTLMVRLLGQARELWKAGGEISTLGI